VIHNRTPLAERNGRRSRTLDNGPPLFGYRGPYFRAADLGYHAIVPEFGQSICCLLHTPPNVGNRRYHLMARAKSTQILGISTDWVLKHFNKRISDRSWVLDNTQH
jgi:hypothetical protein